MVMQGVGEISSLEYFSDSDSGERDERDNGTNKMANMKDLGVRDNTAKKKTAEGRGGEG